MYKFNTCLDLLGIDCVLGVGCQIEPEYGQFQNFLIEILLNMKTKMGEGVLFPLKALPNFCFFKIRNCLIFRFGSFPLNTFVVLTIHSSRNYRVFRIGAFRISIVKFVCIPFHVISFLDFIEMMYIVCTLYCTVYLAFRRYSLLFYDYIPIYFY